MTKVTGWARLRRWIKRISLGILALLILLLVVGAIYEVLARANARSKYPPRGRMVDVGGRRMHIDCRGAGSPTVILESGLGTGGTLDWTLVHDEIASFTRTCAYDRAGIMWSDPKVTPQDATAVTEDLRLLLARAGVTDPLVLVGHSIGGPYTRTYTGKYGDQVAGLVMVDPSQPDQVARLGKVAGTDVHPRRASTIMHAATALSWTGLVRLIVARRETPKLRTEAQSRRLNDALVVAAAYASTSFKGSRSELEGFDRTMDQARAVHDFGNRPLIVLTAMAPFTPEQLKGLDMKTEVGARFKQEWKTLHSEQAAFSTRGRQQLVPDATHYIQVDRPEIVIAAVREVVDMVRADALVAGRKRQPEPAAPTAPAGR